MAGNDENSLFQWLFRELLPNEGDYDSADVLCISDFGWAPINSETMEIISQEKTKGVKFFGLNIDNKEEGHSAINMDMHIVGPKEVCDSLWEYSNGVCKESVSL